MKLLLLTLLILTLVSCRKDLNRKQEDCGYVSGKDRMGFTVTYPDFTTEHIGADSSTVKLGQKFCGRVLILLP